MPRVKRQREDTPPPIKHFDPNAYSNTVLPSIERPIPQSKPRKLKMIDDFPKKSHQLTPEPVNKPRREARGAGRASKKQKVNDEEVKVKVKSKSHKRKAERDDDESDLAEAATVRKSKRLCRSQTPGNATFDARAVKKTAASKVKKAFKLAQANEEAYDADFFTDLNNDDLDETELTFLERLQAKHGNGQSAPTHQVEDEVELPALRHQHAPQQQAPQQQVTPRKMNYIPYTPYEHNPAFGINPAYEPANDSTNGWNPPKERGTQTAYYPTSPYSYPPYNVQGQQPYDEAYPYTHNGELPSSSAYQSQAHHQAISSSPKPLSTIPTDFSDSSSEVAYKPEQQSASPAQLEPPVQPAQPIQQAPQVPPKKEVEVITISSGSEVHQELVEANGHIMYADIYNGRDYYTRHEMQAKGQHAFGNSVTRHHRERWGMNWAPDLSHATETMRLSYIRLDENVRQKKAELAEINAHLAAKNEFFRWASMEKLNEYFKLTADKLRDEKTALVSEIEMLKTEKERAKGDLRDVENYTMGRMAENARVKNQCRLLELENAELRRRLRMNVPEREREVEAEWSEVKRDADWEEEERRLYEQEGYHDSAYDFEA